MRFSICSTAIGIALISQADIAVAQTSRSERFVPARVLLNDVCPSDPLGTEGGTETGMVAAALIGIASGVVSDIVGSGIQALAGALDEASKAKAVGGEGEAVLQFYTIVNVDGNVVLEPNLPTKKIGTCIIFSVDQSFAHKFNRSKRDDQAPIADDVEKRILDIISYPPAFYVEARLRLIGEGFVMEPNFVWYPHRLRNAPRKAAALELQATFSTPASSNATDAIFSLARVQLPPAAPGTTYTRDYLSQYGSGALPLRPTAGAVDTKKQAISAAWSAVRQLENEIDDLRTVIDYADQDLATAKNPSAELKAAPKIKRREIAGKERELKRAEMHATRLLPKFVPGTKFVPPTLGTTTVRMRAAFVTDPNRFGQALAKALATRAPTAASSLETALTASLTKDSPAAWSALEASYVQAITLVMLKKQAYDTAIAGADAAAQALALAELRNAQAAANSAAALADRPLPYPQLLELLLVQ